MENKEPMETSVSEGTNEKEKNPVKTSGSKGVSRRTLFKGLAAAGWGVAYLASNKQAVAGSYRLLDIGDLSETQLIEMYTQMLQIRWFDRTVADGMLTKRGYRAYGHFACGQEAVSVGCMMALVNKGPYPDWMAGTHRSHAHALAKGADLKKMAAEIHMKAAGTNKGYGGSMHIMQADVGMMAESGIVGGGQIPAAGAAFGLKAAGKGQVSVCMGGDGHMNSPWTMPALMESAKFKLPFIYLIENNGYQASNPIEKCNPHLTEYVSVARGCNVPGEVVDGQSVLEVYSVVKRAVARARAGEGPTFIEAKTYRYYSHFGTGGAKPGVMGAFGLSYRSDREVRHWLAKDPIDIHKNTLVNMGVLSADDASRIEKEQKQFVVEAFDWAEKQPNPIGSDGINNVFSGGPSIMPRQLADCPLYDGHNGKLAVDAIAASMRSAVPYKDKEQHVDDEQIV